MVFKLAAFVFLFWATTTYAIPTTFTFDGAVGDMPEYGWVNVDPLLTGVFSPGEVIHGSYTFESTSSDMVPNDPNIGIYYPILSLDLFVGDYHVTANGGSFIDVGINDPPAVIGYRNTYNVSIPYSSGYDLNAPPIDGLGRLLWVNFGVLWTEGDGFTSDALPTSFPNVTDPDALMYFQMGWEGPVGASKLYGSISSLGSTPVPEPATFILLGAGLAGVGLLRRKLRR